jgi:hypothetical protein
LSERSSALHIPGRPDWAVRAPSRRSRVVEAATAVTGDCGCGAPVVGVLRGFGHAGRAEAAVIRRRLSRHGIEVRDLAAAMTVSAVTTASLRGETLPHMCVYVDATGGAGPEAERVAALAGVPIVRARGRELEDGPAPRLEEKPLLRTFFHQRDELHMFPSVSGQIPDVAFEEVRVVPNQPETGELRLTVGRNLPVLLEIGTELVVEPLPGLARVVARPVRGDERTWMTEEVRVEQVSGLHTVHRDGLCFADLDGVLSIAGQQAGLRRYTV